MIEMLVAAMERARSTEATAIARVLDGMALDPRALGGVHQGWMRAADHQFIQPLYVSVTERAGSAASRTTTKDPATVSEASAMSSRA